MKKYALLAVVAALSACNERAEEAPVATETAAADTAMAANPSTAPGTYSVKMADGTTGTTVINADGTYVDTDKDGKEIKGAFAVRDGKDCFDPEGDAAEECWTIGARNADGSFTATAPDGTTIVTVTPGATAGTGTMPATPAEPTT